MLKDILKWYETLDSISYDYENRGLEKSSIEFGKGLDEFLYYFEGIGVRPNWNGIYCNLAGKDSISYSELIDDLPRDMEPEDIIIPKGTIPDFLRDVFEIGEDGKATGKFNWNYIMVVDEFIKQMNLDYTHSLMDYLPRHVALVIENLDNPEELYEILAEGGKNTKTGVDDNCPDLIKNDPDIMLKLFEIAKEEDIDYIPNFWELTGNGLKGHSEFIDSLKQLLGEDFELIEEFEGKSQKEILEFYKDEEFSKLLEKEKEYSFLEKEERIISETEKLFAERDRIKKDDEGKGTIDDKDGEVK